MQRMTPWVCAGATVLSLITTWRLLLLKRRRVDRRRARRRECAVMDCTNAADSGLALGAVIGQGGLRIVALAYLCEQCAARFLASQRHEREDGAPVEWA